MKNVVTLDEVREIELRSQKSFHHYLSLLNKDVLLYFKEKEEKEVENCPACNSSEYKNQFKKLGFQYRTCNECGTMFVSNHPTDESLENYYKHSQSCKFYYQEFLSKFEKGHSEKLFLKRCDWILDAVIEYEASRNHYLDVRSKYPRLFKTIVSKDFFSHSSTYCPIFGVSVSSISSNEVIRSLRDVKSESVSVISAFEFLDNVFDPKHFIKNIHRVLCEKGLFLLTTRSISGFDMQVLWEKSNSILPPEHVTIFSVEGLIRFFESNGFEIKELSTPGQLDLDIVANEMKLNPGLKLPRFVEYLIKNRKGEAYQSFKEFLQKNRLSSHTRIVVQKVS